MLFGSVLINLHYADIHLTTDQRVLIDLKRKRAEMLLWRVLLHHCAETESPETMGIYVSAVTAEIG